MTPLLEARDVCRTFRRGRQTVTALDHVSLTLSPGEALGVVGQSGSGKTTLLRILAGLLPVSAGQVLLEGSSLETMPRRAVWQTMQMVFQTPQDSFDPRQTLGRAIGEALVNYGVPRNRAAAETAALLERCGLPPGLAGRYPHEVSGGQCQRAAIARALAPQPRLLLCDEATASLDVTVQAQIMELLAGLRQQGMAFVFVSHDLSLVQQFCNRVLVLRGGVVEESGDTDQVLLQPRSPYTQRLVEASF